MTWEEESLMMSPAHVDCSLSAARSSHHGTLRDVVLPDIAQLHQFNYQTVHGYQGKR
jgi:hypothetical protein